MNGSSGSSERVPRPRPDARRTCERGLRRLAVALAWAVFVLCAGCASRSRVVPEPLSTPPVGDLVLEPEDARGTTAPAPFLPGAERVYPSQDPRNQAAPGAPEAFPAAPSGAVSAPPPPPEEQQPEMPSGEAAASPLSSGAEPGASGQSAGPPQGSPAPVEPAGAFAVQLFASGSRATAAARATALARYFDPPPRVVAEGGMHKVRLGPFANLAAAEDARRRAFDLGFRDAFVVSTSAPPASGGR